MSWIRIYSICRLVDAGRAQQLIGAETQLSCMDAKKHQGSLLWRGLLAWRPWRGIVPDDPNMKEPHSPNSFDCPHPLYSSYSQHGSSSGVGKLGTSPARTLVAPPARRFTQDYT